MSLNLHLPQSYNVPPVRPRNIPYSILNLPDPLYKGMNKTLLKWGAAQVKTRYPGKDVYPNPDRYPVAPNLEGIVAYQPKDLAANYYTSYHPPYTCNPQPAPAYWGAQ